MLFSILSQTFVRARRFWARLLGVWVLSWLVSLAISLVLEIILGAGDTSWAMLAALTSVSLLLGAWSVLAAVRVAAAGDSVGEALVNAVPGAPKLLIGAVLLGLPLAGVSAIVWYGAG